MVALVTILAVVVALLAVLVAGLLRSHAEIIRALHDLGADLDPDSAAREARRTPPRGARVAERKDAHAVDIAGETPDGDAVSIGVVGVEHATLVAFLTSGCSTCGQFWQAFGDVESLDVPGHARLVVVTNSGANESVSEVRKLASPGLTVTMSNEAWKAYAVPVAPYFVYVDGPSGTVVGEGAATTWEHVVSLLTRAIEDAGLDPGRKRRRRPRPGADREARIDRELLAAGLRPGDPAFYPGREAARRGEAEPQVPNEDGS